MGMKPKENVPLTRDELSDQMQENALKNLRAAAKAHRDSTTKSHEERSREIVEDPTESCHNV
jgi:hypothetical protein